MRYEERSICMKKESDTLIIICAIILSAIILLLAISNMVAINRIEKAEITIKVLEDDNELLREQMEEYKKVAEELSEQIKDLKINISDVKKSMDQIVPQIAEIKKKDEEKESNLEVSSEEVQRSYTEETTTEYTEEITEEYVEEYVEPEYSGDIPWVVYEVVECEVHGGDKESKMHVAHVIRNRVWSDLFPNNYYDVCTAPYQFCTRSDVEQSTIDAVNEAMSIGDTTGGALFFHSMEYMDSWGGYEYIFTDNVGHHFYGI